MYFHTHSVQLSMYIHTYTSSCTECGFTVQVHRTQVHTLMCTGSCVHTYVRICNPYKLGMEDEDRG